MHGLHLLNGSLVMEERKNLFVCWPERSELTEIDNAHHTCSERHAATLCGPVKSSEVHNEAAAAARIRLRAIAWTERCASSSGTPCL